MSRIGKNPIAIPAGCRRCDRRPERDREGPQGHPLPRCRRADHREDRGWPGCRRASERRAHLAFAPRTVPHPDRQHDHRRDRGLQEGSRNHGHRLPRGRQGQGPEFSLGFSHTITVTPPEGIEFTIAPKSQTLFTVSGIDKQLVGETAARIRKLKKPEPYKGKGIHYVGETIRRKVGKAGK